MPATLRHVRHSSVLAGGTNQSLPVSTETLPPLRRGGSLRWARAIDWDALEPRGLHARYTRKLLNAGLIAACFVPALAIGSVIALANAIAFRSVRRIFYVQLRAGHRGRLFCIYKFRTMSEPQPGESWSQSHDVARVTRFGRFLRNSHLDELPQFLNILLGEMTFIGPRPEMVEIEEWAAANVPGFARRLVLVPGITGYAQITQGYTGRCVESYAKKLEIAEHYRANLSFAMDAEILVRTILWMLRGRGWRWKQNGSQTERVAL